MAHQHPDSTKATAQNTATHYEPASDQARGQHESARPEPKTYAARDVEDSTLAPPAAGETADYMDEGEPSGGAQQGANHTNRELHASHSEQQGRKTREANRRILKGKDA